MILRLVIAFALTATPGVGQQVEEAPGVVLRGIDKISGQVYDIALTSGETALFEGLRITVHSCRFPIGNPSGDAFASLDILDTADGRNYFSGWMIASAPALSSMDHARYDIWVMRCATS
ncbi:MAG: DUF2155 domain-containing protein [Pseudomonadota bacterium]